MGTPTTNLRKRLSNVTRAEDLEETTTYFLLLLIDKFEIKPIWMNP